MKKIKIMTLSMIFCLGIMSCHKDWTCSCTTTQNGVEESSERTILNTKKSIATSNCIGASSIDGIYKSECKLKSKK